MDPIVDNRTILWTLARSESFVSEMQKESAQPIKNTLPSGTIQTLDLADSQ